MPNNLKLLSNRVKKNTGNELATERYEYLSLENAEPDFGLPSANDALIGSDSDGTRRFFTTSSGLSIDGSGVIRADETTLAIDTTGYKYSSSSTLRDVLTDLNTNTTSANTPNTIVFRDANGDFSVNTITVDSLVSTGSLSGTWNGDPIDPEYGGTGIGSGGVTENAVLYGQGVNPMQEATGTAHQVFQLDSSGVPVFGDIDAGNF